MSSPALNSRSFQTTGTSAFVRLLTELFRATPLYLFVTALQTQPAAKR